MSENEIVAALIGAISILVPCACTFVYFDYKYTQLLIATKHNAFKEGYDLATKLSSFRKEAFTPNPGTFN